MSINWKRLLLWNTVTNYCRVIVRIITGFFVFRLLFQHFSTEQFGYWSQLWSGFGISVLADFGLGFTAQRETAYCNARKEWDGLNRLLSTIVWSYCILGLLIFLIFFLIQPFFLSHIHISPSNKASFTNAYWIFFGALAIGFPSGLFNEVLNGLQRFDLGNWAQIVGSLVNLLFVHMGLQYHWPFETFIFIGVVTSLGPNLFSYIMVRRLIPTLSLNPRLFHHSNLKRVMSFSIISYISTWTTLIITRTDQTVISFCIGVAWVTVYQAGFKVAEMFCGFTLQMQGALSATAAHLKAQEDYEALQRLLIKTTRITVLFSTPAYIFGAVYLEHLIRLVTGLKSVDSTTLWVGQALLLSAYSMLLTSSCTKWILVMSGWEKPLLKLSVTEALANLFLSVFLVYKMGVFGVALGTLIPGVLVGWLGIQHLNLSFTRLRLGEWIRQVYSPVLLPICLSLVLLYAMLHLWPLPEGSKMWILHLALQGTLFMTPTAIFLLKERKTLF